MLNHIYLYRYIYIIMFYDSLHPSPNKLDKTGKHTTVSLNLNQNNHRQTFLVLTYLTVLSVLEFLIYLLPERNYIVDL